MTAGRAKTHPHKNAFLNKDAVPASVLWYGEGLKIYSWTIGPADTQHTFSIPSSGKGNWFILHYALLGSVNLSIDSVTNFFHSNDHNLICYPGSEQIKLTFPDRQTQNISILVSVDFLNERAKELLHAGTLADMLSVGTANILSFTNLPVTPALKAIIQQIAYSEMTHPLKEVFLQSKAFELLTLQLEQASTRPPLTPHGIDQLDLQKLYSIRDLIDNDFSAEYTLTKLSRLAGLNLFKLKNGFRLLFGKPVYRYIRDLRMNCAFNLLQKETHSIHEIAVKVGYKNPQHFTTAFKKMFGVSPIKIKNKTRQPVR
jgi:AraC family transcriptional activator of pyochelin receptor